MDAEYGTFEPPYEGDPSQEVKSIPTGVWIGIGLTILAIVIIVIVIIISVSSKKPEEAASPALTPVTVPVTPSTVPVSPAPVVPVTPVTPTAPSVPAPVVPVTPAAPSVPVVPAVPAPVVPVATTVTPAVPVSPTVTPAVPASPPSTATGLAPLPPISSERFLPIPTDTTSLIASSRVYVPNNPSTISYIRRYPTPGGGTIALKYFPGYDSGNELCYSSETGNALEDAAIQVGWMIINRLNRPVTLYFRNLVASCSETNYLSNRLALVKVPAGTYTAWYMVPYSNGTYPLLSVGCSMEIHDENGNMYKKSKDITRNMGAFIVYEINE